MIKIKSYKLFIFPLLLLFVADNIRSEPISEVVSIDCTNKVLLENTLDEMLSPDEKNNLFKVETSQVSNEIREKIRLLCRLDCKNSSTNAHYKSRGGVTSSKIIIEILENYKQYLNDKTGSHVDVYLNDSDQTITPRVRSIIEQLEIK